MNFVLKYSPSPHTPLPRERGGVYLYFRLIFNWGEGISLLIILLFTAHVAHAQTFPVRVTPVLTPPYTPFLTDYTDPGAERLTLQIMLNDLTVTEFRTKLRMTIEGVGITITTNPNYFPPPISLQGGVPQLIYGSDIADYFKMSNLVFQGLNPNEVQKNGGRLPEGIYRISFEVLDYNRNTVVSNKGSATAWMILNDPPFINLPVNNAKIKPLNPQNIVFQWTPRHRGSPNAAFTTDYDVKLVEIWPAGRNPFDAINTSRPIFETTTSATMVVYGPAETPLVLGREYALQVRARDNGGRDVFKNNGYSEVVRFIYGDECPMPSGLNADDINISKARMRWQGSGQNSDYLLRYREKKEGARWFEEKTNQSYYNASGLRPGTTYEYTLAGECDIYQSDFTGIQSFTTLAENPNAFVCADPNSVPPPDGSPPLPALFTNDFIHAGGFDVVVNKATGSNGRFTGEGLAVVPWFNSAKVRVTFENIGVNTSYQLTAGEIKSVWDPNSRSMLVNEKTIAEEGGPSNQFNSDIQTFEPDTAIMVTGVILSAYNDPDGNTVLETNEGRIVLPKGTSYAIADDAGNGYIVDKEGNIKKTTAADALAAGAKANREYSTDPNLKVIFSRADDTKYGFDEPQTVLPQNYQQTEAGDKVAWKALAAGLTDNIVAASQGVGDIGKATFRLEPNSQALNPTIAGTGQVSLTLTGGGDGVVNELLAYYPNPDTSKTDLVAGKLNVVSYDLVNKSLVLITVNATTTTLAPNSLQTDLNNIYSQGVVQWTVNSTQSINVSGIDENALDDGGSGLLSNYTEDMKKILRAYTADHAMADNTYYLFLVKNSTSQSKLGYMPRKKQAGFIFVDSHKDGINKIENTIAHELGHGAFHLKHIFSEYSLNKGVTENLMDYPAKTRLDKWQWDHIHNPEAVLGLFEGDDEGASLCTWWYRNITSYIWPSEQDKALKERAPLFNHIKENFDTYFTASQSDNIDIIGYKGWSARKSAFSKRSNLTLVDRVIKKFIDQTEPSFELFSKGIFLSEYTIEGKKYKVVLYSENKSVSLNKVKVDGLCELVDHENAKIVLEDGYILITFFKDRVLQMTLQICGSDKDEDAKMWLKYLAVLEEQSTWRQQVIDYWKQLWDQIQINESPGFPVTVGKVEEIFPNTSKERITQVVDVVNEFSGDFGLTTKESMALFIGQIGHESNSLRELVESHNYSAETIYKTFLKVSRSRSGGGLTYKYCHLIVGYDCADLGSCPSGYKGPNRCSIEPAYLSDSTGALVEYSVWQDSSFVIKPSFINNSNLFNLTYGCRLGNSHFNSGDGAKFRGRGFIQLTGKAKYEELTNMWNEKFPDDPKDFAGDDYELVGTDVKVGLMVALFEWERLMKDSNSDYFKEAVEGKWSDKNIKLVGRAINGSGELNESNGESDRIAKCKKAYEKL